MHVYILICMCVFLSVEHILVSKQIRVHPGEKVVLLRNYTAYIISVFFFFLNLTDSLFLCFCQVLQITEGS